MSSDTREKMLSTYAQIRRGLEKSQKLIAALEPVTLGDDGEAAKAAMLQRFSQQIAQLRYLEVQLTRRIETQTESD